MNKLYKKVAVIPVFITAYFLFSFCFTFSANAQYDVTTVYTDYGGYWASSAPAMSNNPVKPENNHNLLAFHWNGTTFSTGANDALLTTNGVTFTAKNFRAFPVNSVAATGGTYVALGQLYDGVNNNISVPAPFTAPATSSTLASFLTDGTKGLNLGTGVANIAAGQLRFNLSSLGISASAINDAVPDVVVTQIASPSATVDEIYFVDINGLTVGSKLSINHTSVPVVGSWMADFYLPDGTQSNPTLRNTQREIRLWAADLTSFGITALNVGNAVALIYDLKGSSDVAFVAFNVPSISVATQLSTTTQPSSSVVAACCNNTGSNVLSQQPVVRVLDGSGNNINQSGLSVTASISSGPSGHGNLGGTTTVVTNGTGEAIFTNLSLPCEMGAYTLSFSSSSLTPASTTNISVVQHAYYVKSGSSANLSNLSSWAENADGTGASPTDFGTGKKFIVNNSANETNFSTGGNWTITGVLNVPAGKTVNITTGTTTTLSCDIEQGGTVIGAAGSSVVLNGTSAQTLGGTNSIKDLTINNTSGVTLTSNVTVDNTLTLTAGTLNIGGNTLTINGTVSRTSGAINASAASATVIFGGTSAQTITAAIFTGNIYNLSINNAASVSLASNLTISNAVALTNGRLSIGTYTLNATTITGGNTTNYIQTNSTGKLQSTISNTSSRLFPVGNSSYNPVTITNNSGSADAFAVRVIDEVYTNGTSGTALTGPRITRTWDIDKTTANGGTGINFSFQWQAGQNTNVLSPALYHYQGGAWVKQTNGTTSYPNSTTFNYTGYTGTFSPFAIGDNGTTLPLTWQSFTVQKQTNKTILQWQTAAEQNSKDFTIQHSVDNIIWSNAGVVQAAGNSSNTRHYTFMHYSPVKGMNYYRLLQSDIDGRSSYSDTRTIFFSNNNTGIALLSNPVINGSLSIQVNQAQSVSLLTTDGKLLWQKQLTAGIRDIPVGNLSSGIYILRTTDSSMQVLIQKK